MEINRTNIMEIVNKSNARPDKDYGQNFLIEPNVSKEIVDALEIEQDDTVLEIGPGLGSLTHFLSLTEASVTVVDIDKRMTDFLSLIYKSDKIEIINEDIRKVNIAKYSKIVGNLPYNITTELVTYLLKYATSVKKMVLMCQTEAFDRFNDIKGKEYGPISVLLHLLGDTKKVRLVKAGSFYPVPKCGSLVFEIVFNNNLNRETALKVYDMCRQLFANRRKTIYNNLSNYLKDRELSESLCQKLNIPLNNRPEDIAPNQYLDLFETINNNK